MKIFGIGITGLVGSRIVELLQHTYEFTNLSLETGVNITDPQTLDVIRNDNSHALVLHLAAKADVDGCEKDKLLGHEGDAYKINVTGVRNIIESCRKGNKKLLYISTDFVFGGEEPGTLGFTETDTPHPVNWYGETKMLAENEVKASGLQYLIARIAYPYRKEFELKSDFVRVIAQRLSKHEKISGVTDHIFTPTFIDDIAYAIQKLIETECLGIYHIVGNQSLTPYEAACKIADVNHFDKTLIIPTTREEFFKDRAKRPFNLHLNNDKMVKLGIALRSFDEGLIAMR